MNNVCVKKVCTFCARGPPANSRLPPLHLQVWITARASARPNSPVHTLYTRSYLHRPETGAFAARRALLGCSGRGPRGAAPAPRFQSRSRLNYLAEAGALYALARSGHRRQAAAAALAASPQLHVLPPSTATLCADPSAALAGQPPPPSCSPSPPAPPPSSSPSLSTCPPPLLSCPCLHPPPPAIALAATPRPLPSLPPLPRPPSLPNAL